MDSDAGRHPAAPGVASVPPALLRQHRRPARPADDGRDDRGAGLHTDRLVVRGRTDRRARAGAAGGVRSVRRSDRGRDGPSAARADRVDGVVGGVTGAGGAGVPGQHQHLGDLRLRGRAVGVLRGDEPGARRDDRAAAAGRAAARRECAELRDVQPRLHRGPDARGSADLGRRLRARLHRRCGAVHRDAVRDPRPRRPDARGRGRCRRARAARARGYGRCATDWRSCAARRTCG